MSTVYEELNEKLIDFIRSQKMFFVASAPLSAEGHVNVSPKGYDCFRIVNPRQVAYLDLGGSGIETVAHARENGRITIMFCAFQGAPLILRLYGRATIMQFDHPSFSQELTKFPGFKRARNVVFIDIERIADSCGYGVPFYEFQGPRDQLQRSVEHREQEEWERRRFESNAQSIDGLEGLTRKRTENLA
jgi:hypothetical protein